MAQVSKVKLKVTYNGVDITEDITRYLLSATYVDNDEGESDNIEITVEDVDGLWKNGWYPTKGAKLGFSIGYESDDLLVDHGEFEIDEILLTGPPDTVTMKALAAGGVVLKSLRTKRSKSFENLTLREIAAYIANKNKLILEGAIPSVRFERVTQHRETDLSFLRRISIEYGCLFSVRNSKLTFTISKDLELAAAVAIIDRTDCRTYSIKDKTGDTYKEAKVKYRNPNTGKVPTATVTKVSNRDGYTYNQISTDDTLEIRTKAENPDQAEKKAEAALHKKNSEQQEGTLTGEGRPTMIAGNNFMFTGLGVVSGKYYIKKSTHKVDKGGGYTITVDFKRTLPASAAQQTGTKSSTPKNNSYGVTPFTNADGIQFLNINLLPK